MIGLRDLMDNKRLSKKTYRNNKKSFITNLMWKSFEVIAKPLTSNTNYINRVLLHQRNFSWSKKKEKHGKKIKNKELMISAN